MATVYRHTQLATNILIPIDGAMLFIVYLAITQDLAPLLAVAAGLGFLGALFASLTVEGTETELEIRFGIGLIRKRFRLGEIVEVRPYRTSFWHGWGIRISSDGIIYNVAGYDAVLLRLQTGKQVIIGTDDRNRFLAYLREYTRLRPAHF